MKLYFKTIFVATVPFIITLFFAYLIGCFLNVTWNPEFWTVESRQFMTVTGLVFGFMLSGKLWLEGLV